MSNPDPSRARVLERSDGTLMLLAPTQDPARLPARMGRLIERGQIELERVQIGQQALSQLQAQGFVVVLGDVRVSVLADLRRQARNAGKIASRRRRAARAG